MPTNPGPNPRILWGVLGILLLAAAIFLSNRTAVTPDGVLVITDRSGYVDAVKKAESLSKDILIEADKGATLTSEQVDKVRESAKIFDGIIRYQPNLVQPYFSAGRCYEAAGQKQTAKERYEQAVRNKGFENTEFGKIAAIEAGYRLALLLLEDADNTRALGLIQTALKEFETLRFAEDQTGVQNALAGKYFTGLARVQIQLKKLTEAKESLDKALTYAPGLQEAESLRKLIDSAK